MRYFSVIAFSLAGLFALDRCGGMGSSGETVGLKAALSSAAYSVSTTSPFDKIWRAVVEQVAFAAGATRVNKVWALPMFNGEFHPSSMSYVKRESVGADGSFSLSLEEMDWGIVLVDTAQSADLDKIVGYVTMTAGDAGLQNMALGSATDNIDLGTLTSNGTETSSTNTAATNATKFGFTEAQLLAMAKTDDTLKVIKNVFGNFNESTGLYTTIKPFYLWKYSNAIGVIKDTYSTPATTVANFAGYLYYFNSSNTAINYSQVCANTQALAVYPPSTVTNMSQTVTFNATTPLTSAGSSNGTGSDYCGIGHIYLRDDTGKYGSGANFQFNFGISGEYLKPPIPSGNWILKAGSTTIATFDGQLGSPFVASDTTKPIILIPAMKATSSGSNISSVNIRWYQRNATSGAYDEVTDSALLKQMKSVFVEMSQYTGGTYSEMRNFDEGTTDFTFTPSTYSWRFPSLGSGGKAANDIALGYQLNGISYRFEHRMQ